MIFIHYSLNSYLRYEFSEYDFHTCDSMCHIIECSHKGCHFHGHILRVVNEVRLETLCKLDFTRCVKLTKQFDILNVQVAWS